MLSKLTLSLRDNYAAAIVAATIMAGTGISSVPANAEAITVGAANGSGQGVLNGQVNGHTRYQQVYGAEAFDSTDGPIYINSLTFFAATNYFISIPGFPGGGLTIPLSPESQSIASGDYTIRLSTTDSAVDGLATSFNSNWGDDVEVFFSGLLSDTLTIAGETPFLYDPTMGNLLLDITVNSQTPNGGQLLSYHESLLQFNRGQTDQMSSRTGTGANAISTGIPWTRSTGYVTEFGYTTTLADPAAIPEPDTIALLGIGLLAFCATAIRRRCNSI